MKCWCCGNEIQDGVKKCTRCGEWVSLIGSIRNFRFSVSMLISVVALGVSILWPLYLNRKTYDIKCSILNFVPATIEGKPSLMAKVAFTNGGNTEAIVVAISFGGSFGLGLAGRTPVPLVLPPLGRVAFGVTVSSPSLPLVLKPGDITIVYVILSLNSEEQLKNLGFKGLNRRGEAIRKLGLIVDVIDNHGEMREGIYNGFELPFSFSLETIEIKERVLQGAAIRIYPFETPIPFK